MSKVTLREINLIAAPAILSAVSEPLIALADNGIINNFSKNPTVATGAVGLASSFFLLIVWIFSQTRTAMSTVVSQYYGANKLPEIKNLVPQMIWMNFGIGLIFTILTKTFAENIFDVYNAKGETLQNTIEYFQIRAYGFPFTLATLLIFGVFRGLQNTFWTMVITLVGASFNLLLDIVLLKGLPGIIEPMGIKGVALSSVLIQILMFLFALIFYLKHTPFPIFFKLTKHPQFFKFMRMSGNLIIRSLAVNAVYFFSIKFATSYGPDYLAVQTISLQLWFFCAFFIEGYANAGNALVGKFVGQGNKQSLIQLTAIMRNMTIKVALFLSVILLIFYYPLADIFLDTPITKSIFYSCFWLLIIMQPVIAIAFVYDDFMKGAGIMAPLRNVLLFSTFCGFVPCLYLFDYLDWKILAVWVAFNIWMIIRATLLSITFTNYLNNFDSQKSLVT